MSAPLDVLLAAPVERPLPAYRRLDEVTIPDESERYLSGIPGLDLCLSEHDDAPPGIPLASSILIAGSPGGGKSTLVSVSASAAALTAATPETLGGALVISGEEREYRVRRRFARLNLQGIPNIARLQDAEEIGRLILFLQPRVTVVDSIQTLSFQGGHKYDDQFEAVKYLEAVAVGIGGCIVFISHVAKTGRDHAGAQGLPHLVDVHLHMMVNAKKSERTLEVRKNRHGRAGFQVPVHIGPASISVGTPAPITGDGSMAGARTKLEMCVDAATKALEEGRTLSGYDFDIVPGVSGGLWRTGLEMATKRLIRDGVEVLELKVNGRRSYRLANPPPPADGAEPAVFVQVPGSIEPEQLVADLMAELEEPVAEPPLPTAVETAKAKSEEDRPLELD